MFAGPLPRELKPPGVRVPARRPRGRASPHTSLNPERRVPARALQAPACPRTWTPFAADTQRLAAPPPRRAALLATPSLLAAPPAALLVAPFPSPWRLAHRPARCADPLAVSPRSPPMRRVRRTARRPARYRGAFAHPTRWHSVSARSEPAQRAISPQQWSRCAITPQQWSQRAITPQQRHHEPPADAYEPLAKWTSQELHPDLGC